MPLKSPVIQTVSLSATALALLAPYTLPEQVYSTLIPLLSITLIGVFGIPHGAADHLIYMHTHHAHKFQSAHFLAFITGYLTLMFAHVLVWYFSPMLAFAIFLVFSVFHFGQAEFEYLNRSVGVPAPVYWSRGALVLSMFAFSQPHVSFPIVSAVLNVHFHPRSGYLYVIPCALMVHFLTLWFYQMRLEFIKDQVYRIIVIMVLFLTVHTYLAFAVYFSFFHALEFMYSSQLSTFKIPVWKTLVPFSVPVLGLIAMHWKWIHWFTKTTTTEYVGQQLDILTTWHAFILVVSVLTTPHVLYLHYLNSNE